MFGPISNGADGDASGVYRSSPISMSGFLVSMAVKLYSEGSNKNTFILRSVSTE